MPRPLSHRLIARTATRVPGVRRLPVFKLLAIGEIALLARDHFSKLDAEERRRLLTLVRKGKGRTRDLSLEEREELQRLVAKAEPRMFVGTAADKLSPVPLPQRFREGR